MRLAVPVNPWPQQPAKRTWAYTGFEKCTGALRKLAWAARGTRIVFLTLGRYSRLNRYAHTAVTDGSTERWVRCAH
jgi:hypothetical protein